MLAGACSSRLSVDPRLREDKLGREHGAIRAPRFELARKKTKHWIMAQLVMIVQILIAERDAVHTLRHQRFQAVLDLILGAPYR